MDYRSLETVSVISLKTDSFLSYAPRTYLCPRKRAPEVLLESLGRLLSSWDMELRK